MNTINKMNPLFKQGQPGDSKDFIIFILEQFHKELKKKVNILNKNSNLDQKQSLNQYDRNNAFIHFLEQFKEECSIISDIFFGINETTNECLYCKNIYNSQGYPNNPICYNFGIFNCIIFPLEEVRKKKYNSMGNNINSISLYDCFLYNQKSDLFSGSNKNYCNICNQLSESLYTSKIFSSPLILILILNRGKNNIYNVKLHFTETINITEFILQRDMPQMIYELYGVITHIGKSGPNAHFVASCRSSVDNKWYRFNDALINPIHNLERDVLDFGTPYILFYKKINN
jgi:ubiquitin C-terminal hydrolase